MISSRTRVWSPSQVLSYRTCPRQWMLRYKTSSSSVRAIMAEQAPLVMLLGTVAHLGLEAAYRAAARGFAIVSDSTMAVYADVAVEAIRAGWVTFDLEERAESNLIEDEVCAVLAALPRPRPALILGVELTLADEVEGIPFTNVVDLILQTGPAAIHLRDWKRKSYSSLPAREELFDNAQLCAYRHAVARHFPWARKVTVGLYSVISNREVHIELPMPRAETVMSGEAATIRKAESDTLCAPTPDGANCQKCSVKPACPVWT